ncbi:MAG: hypothetical protein GQ540_00205 [Lutibacter sp.]|uniref:hypothetical protein n=1 Tax=Lutibacter sp. TaxID=1925666 RepID=UPI0019E9C522|nr:hypothetical protein [Lutibacter sp.]NOR26931.1 hypothetical protein [Lutibacter sp.]
MSKLKFTYKISKENNLITIVQEGILNLDSMMNFINTLNSDPLFSPKFDHIVDLNNVQFELSLEDINKYVQHLESNSKIYGVKKIALITNTPNQVVYSTLFKEAQEQLQPLQSVQIFSTLESAYNFVEKENISFAQILQTVNISKKELIA